MQSEYIVNTICAPITKETDLKILEEAGMLYHSEGAGYGHVALTDMATPPNILAKFHFGIDKSRNLDVLCYEVASRLLVEANMYKSQNTWPVAEAISKTMNTYQQTYTPKERAEIVDLEV